MSQELEAALEEQTERAESMEKAESEPSIPGSEEEKQQELYSSKFAALSRMDREFQKQKKEFEAQRKAWEEEKTSLAQRAEHADSVLNRLQNPGEALKLMEEHGLTYEQLTKLVLNDGEPTPDMLVNKTEEKLMNRINELEQKLEERERQKLEQYESQQIDAFKGQINDFINSNEEFEVIRAMDAAGEVFTIIEEHFNETGKVLDIQEAAQQLEEEYRSHVKELYGNEKIKNILGLQEEVAKESPFIEKPVTLTNDSPSPLTEVKREKALSDHEQILNAANKLKFNS